MAFNIFMADIYRRLKPLGFNPSFVREVILPDWWDDELASVPANRALAEASIAKHLRISIKYLCDPTAPLNLPQTVPFRLKSATRGTNPEAIRPSIVIARRAAEVLAQGAASFPVDAVSWSAAKVRSHLLASEETVTLQNLLDFCWERGIVVAHLDRLPNERGFRKFDGLALFVDHRPCILLAEKHDAPAMLAFHLAHELGHLMHGHVAPGHVLLPDDNLDRVVTDDVEKAADEFACEVLTGHPAPKMDAVYGLTSPKLSAASRRIAKSKNIDPAVFALVYGRNADRMPVAMKALHILNAHSGARRIIRDALLTNLAWDEIQDSSRHFVEQLVLADQIFALPHEVVAT